MPKRAVFKGLDIQTLNLRSLLEDLRIKKFTGFLKVSYWNRDEFLLLFEGRPLRGIALSEEGKFVKFPPQDFALKDQRGSASLFEASLFEIVLLENPFWDPLKHGPLVFLPFGDTVQEDIFLGYVDLEKELLMIERSHLYGYVALYTTEEIVGMILFENGKCVGIFAGDGNSGQGAKTYISTHFLPAKTYLTAVSLEPEIVNLFHLSRRENLGFVEGHQEGPSYFRETQKSGLVVSNASSLTEIDVFYKGSEAFSVVKEAGVILGGERAQEVREKIKDLPGVESRSYEFISLEPPSYTDFKLDLLSQTAGPILSSDKIEEVKSLYVSEIGPVGKILWEKTLEGMGLKEGGLSAKTLKLIIERLADEIPEGEARREFMNRVRSIVPEAFQGER